MADKILWHILSLKEIYRKLNTSEKGLSTEAADEKLKADGPNELPQLKTDNWAVIFFRQFHSPLIYVLLAATIIVFLLNEYTDGFIILFVLLFNAVVGSVQEGRAQNAILALKKFVETYVSVLRDGREIIIQDSRLVPGDIIILTGGDKVPADCRLITANNLRVDEAALTGESSSVPKIAVTMSKKKAAVTEQKNIVFKGTGVVFGKAKAVVVATGIETEVGEISRLITGIRTEIPFRASVRNFSKMIVSLVAAISVFLMLAGLLLQLDLRLMFLTAVSLGVSVIPEGLPIVSTLILALGVTRMAKHNALVRRLQAVEALGRAKILAVDKTGTVTKNEMIIREVFTDGRKFKISGEGYRPKGGAFLNGKKISAGGNPSLFLSAKIAAFCADADVRFLGKAKTAQIKGEPTEAAMLVLAEKFGIKKSKLEEKYPQIKEIPFDYRRRYHATFHKVGRKVFISVAGAPEAILSMCDKFWIKEKVLNFTAADKKEMEEVFHAMSRRGLRVVAFSFLEFNNFKKSSNKIPKLIFGGFYGMEDGIRKEVPAAVKKVKQAGMKMVMITGDHRLTAVSIAEEAGIFKKGDLVLTGVDLENLSNGQLDKILNKVSIFARVTPENKMRIIEAYRRRGDVVAMTGDGVNDALSLVAADLGVAMGGIGTQVARDSADIILLDDNFGTIVDAVKEGRHIYSTIKKAILYLFSTSIGEALVIIGSILGGLPLPLLPVQIIWLNLVTDGFLTVAFAWEPHDKKLVNGRIEKPAKYLIDELMAKRTLVMGITMMVFTLLIFRIYLMDSYAKALTMSLTALAIMQWFNAWNVRSEGESLFTANPLTNKFLLASTGAIIILQATAVYWSPLQLILKTAPLTLWDWLAAAGVALPIIVVEEVRKFFYREDQK